MVECFTKTCYKCKKVQPMCNFNRDCTTPSGLNAKCKCCLAAYRRETKEQRKIYDKKYLNNYRNKSKKMAKRRIAQQFRLINDHGFKLRRNVSRAINRYIHGFKSGSVKNYLQYSIDELKNHLESKFEPWMSWDNYGPASLKKRTWHIDHIIPQSKLPYDSMEHPNFKKCWSLENLRPLEALKNISKGNK